mmetsp:Transcript_118227/g.314610  ORF Transcript_118227/g.314610 Transcript_118227/m.314610 type:complete len:206 (+) Transcript_118227:560-1177(+)
MPLGGLGVEALGQLLPSDVHTLVSEDARHGPLLVVRVVLAGLGDALAGPLVDLVKVYGLGDAHPVPIPVQEELRGHRLRLDDDVLDPRGLICNLEFVPAAALVPREEGLLSRLHHVGHDEQAPVVPELVDEGALVDFEPREPAVPRQVRVGVLLFGAQVGSDVPAAHDDSHRIPVGIDRRKSRDLGEVVQVQPTVVRIALDVLAI